MFKKLVSFIVLPLVLLGVFAASYAGDAVPIGVVIASKNQVTNSKGQALKRGDQVYINDVINTGDDSNVTIKLNDDSIVSLRPDTSYACTNFVIDKNNPKNTQYASNLARGAILFISSQANPEGYKVKTPSSLIAIRGSVVYIAIRCKNGTSQCKDYTMTPSEEKK